jgi:hypothetical protein
MASKDFYLTPGTLSTFFVEAAQKAGYGEIVGWRSAQAGQSRAGGSPQGVEALTKDGKVIRISTNAASQVVVEDISDLVKVNA